MNQKEEEKETRCKVEEEDQIVSVWYCEFCHSKRRVRGFTMLDLDSGKSCLFPEEDPHSAYITT